jgi:hypothetical protein
MSVYRSLTQANVTQYYPFSQKKKLCFQLTFHYSSALHKRFVNIHIEHTADTADTTESDLQAQGRYITSKSM